MSTLLRKLWVPLTLAVCVTCVCLGGCAEKGQTYSVFGLGSLLQVVDYSADENLREFSERTIAEVQAAIDVTADASDIAVFNAAADEERVEVSALTYDMVQQARLAYRITEGLYDPTVYWSVDLWGFLPRKAGVGMPYDREQQEDGSLPLPDAKYVYAFRLLTDMRKIESIKEDAPERYYLIKHDTAVVVNGVTYYARLDLGGIAKGYVIDRIKEYAAAHDIKKGYMSFGASSLLLLENRKGQAWDLSLTNPRATDASPTYFTIPAMDVAVATSGDYQNYYISDGVRYSHLIDPRTGRPYEGRLMTVSVLSQDACMGDALATALTIGGLERLEAFAQSDYAKENGVQLIAAYTENGQTQVFTTLAANKDYNVKAATPK